MMNRRHAIKSMTWATTGVLALSYCSPLPELAYSRVDLNKKDRNLIVYISLQILSEDPLNFPTRESREEFVFSWINDMFTDQEINDLEKGLKLFKGSFEGYFSNLTSEEQNDLLRKSLEGDDAVANFVKQIKNISVLHFRTTENYMTQYLNYEFIPGRYYGCINRVQV